MATVDAGSVQTTSGRGREWEIWKGRALLYLLRLWEIFRKLLRSRVGFTGLFIVVGFILLAVAAPFFAGPDAPFSWRPELVEVLDSGTLALTSGPVRDPTGRRTGTFNSIWRREPNDQWRVVFDKGCPAP